MCVGGMVTISIATGVVEKLKLCLDGDGALHAFGSYLQVQKLII